MWDGGANQRSVDQKLHGRVQKFKSALHFVEGLLEVHYIDARPLDMRIGVDYVNRHINAIMLGSEG